LVTDRLSLCMCKSPSNVSIVAASDDAGLTSKSRSAAASAVLGKGCARLPGKCATARWSTKPALPSEQEERDESRLDAPTAPRKCWSCSQHRELLRRLSSEAEDMEESRLEKPESQLDAESVDSLLLADDVVLPAEGK